MAYRKLILSAALTAALAGAAGWLTSSESGLQTLARLGERLSGEQLKLGEVRGSLRGPLAIGQLSWQGADLQVEATQLHLEWTPSLLFSGNLEIALLRAERLAITTSPSQEPSVEPDKLRLPLAVDAKKIEISEFSWGNTFKATGLSGSLLSDGRHHQLDNFHLGTEGVTLNGRATLDGMAPLPIEASLDIAGRLDERPLAVTLKASGPLASMTISAEATQGISGRAEAVVTPFAEAAFTSARIQLEDVDPSTWQPGAPQARLSISADVVPREGGIIGSFGLTNHRSGPLDRQRLPLETLAGSLDWQGTRARLDSLNASLPGGGELAGSGQWQDGMLSLDLTASRLDASRLVASLRPTRLGGPLAARLAADQQSVKVDLKDRTFSLAADVRHADGRIDLPQLLLAAGDARLSAKGELDLKAPRRFAAEGELQRFNPARFAKLPAARINASFKTSGQLAPRPVVDASFTLHESQLAGQPIAGQGQLNIDWPRIPRADLQLTGGANRLTTRGAFGGPGDSLSIEVDAPQLAPYGLEGSLAGRFVLSGGSDRPRLNGSLSAARLGLPGTLRLSGLQLTADAAADPASPLSLDLAIATLSTPDQPELLCALRLLASGNQQAHRLTLSGQLADDQKLSMVAEGGLDTKMVAWQGKLLEASLAGDKGSLLRLVEPTTLRLAADAWQFGPARLTGRPLDWQATLQASADRRQLRASLSARGQRIGQLDGELSAALQGAWSLDRQAPWQGTLNSEFSDLGWLAEQIGEGWQSAGRLSGQLRLAGTPARPLTNGSLRGDRLALRFAEQGLNLAGGELDIQLRDNLLRINRLAFDSLLQPMPRSLLNSAGKTLAKLTERPGRLEISGEMRVDRALQDATAGGGIDQDNAFFDIRLDRLGALQLPDQWIALSGDGRLSWQGGRLGARGKLAVDAGYWQLAPGGSPRLSDDVVVKRASDGKGASPTRPQLDLDISTDLGEHFLFKGAGLASRLAGEVRIAASGRDLPRASGTIRTVGGRFDAYGQKLDIERGVLSFNGLLDNPGLDVRAVRKGLPVEPGVQISGTARRPVVKLVSDPDLPDAEKLAWLVLGHGPETMSAGDAAVLLSAAGGLLGNDSGGVVQQVKKTFGIDEIGVRQGNIGDTGSRQLSSRVAGGGSIESGNTGNQILSVGKRLSSNALLSYEQTLGRAEGIVKLTVNLTRQIAVVGRAGSDNALDIFYTLTFGGSDKKTVGK